MGKRCKWRGLQLGVPGLGSSWDWCRGFHYAADARAMAFLHGPQLWKIWKWSFTNSKGQVLSTLLLCDLVYFTFPSPSFLPSSKVMSLLYPESPLLSDPREAVGWFRFYFPPFLTVKPQINKPFNLSETYKMKIIYYLPQETYSKDQVK